MSMFNSPNPETYDLLMARRSVKARDMAGPGPDDKDIKKIVSAACRVPDHGKLAPWRYIVLKGGERETLGRLISEALIMEGQAKEKTADKMAGYATQGPVLVVAVYSPSDKKAIPEWEQQLSMGAVCQNMLIAATALGYASQWLTGWAAFSPTVRQGLKMTSNERIAGLMFFGNHDGDKPLSERERPDTDSKIIWGFPHTG